MSAKKRQEFVSDARAHRKPGKGRVCRLAKQGRAADAIGKIERGQDVFVLTFGQFSLIDALVHILDQTGPASVDFSTWTAADAHLQRSMELVESAQITRLRMVVDYSFEGRQPGYCALMRRLFGSECIRTVRTHAKFLVIRSESHDVVVRTSMNLNENPRLENLEVSEDAGFADFFEGIVDEIFKEVGVDERRSRTLVMDGVQDHSPFKEVEARMIPRECLNEPETSHVIKKS